MIHERIEETDGYSGLYGEVVTEDTYRLKQLDFEPDLIFDLGANIGVFSIYARSLFPAARIIAVEPDPENIVHYQKFAYGPGITLIPSAIGEGLMRRKPNPENGAHAAYVDSHLAPPHYTEVVVSTISIEKLMGAYMLGGQRAVLKLDIEGNEIAIFNSASELEAIARVDYFAIEVHREICGETIDSVSDFARQWFGDRYHIETSDVWNRMIYGRKK